MLLFCALSRSVPFLSRSHFLTVHPPGAYLAAHSRRVNILANACSRTVVPLFAELPLESITVTPAESRSQIESESITKAYPLFPKSAAVSRGSSNSLADSPYTAGYTPSFITCVVYWV